MSKVSKPGRSVSNNKTRKRKPKKTAASEPVNSELREAMHILCEMVESSAGELSVNVSGMDNRDCYQPLQSVLADVCQTSLFNWSQRASVSQLARTLKCALVDSIHARIPQDFDASRIRRAAVKSEEGRREYRAAHGNLDRQYPRLAGSPTARREWDVRAFQLIAVAESEGREILFRDALEDAAELIKAEK